MDRIKGIAYCGLACCVCSHNADCAGCRNEGCDIWEECRSYHCCQDKGLDGCWACNEYPCDNPLFDKARVRAFIAFIARYGENKLLDCLERNEAAGMVYHEDGRITGDYDIPATEEEIHKLILNGK